jgi:hypothetical protein
MLLSALGKQVKKYKMKCAKRRKRHRHQDKMHRGHNYDKHHKGEHVKFTEGS